MLKSPLFNYQADHIKDSHKFHCMYLLRASLGDKA